MIISRLLGRTDVMGSVAIGKNSDLVLLDKNPIEDSGNLRRIAGVVRAGFYYSPKDLDSLRTKVANGQGYIR
ncbi:hypothetical protein ACYZUD_09185 [Pseudomonas sp. XS1P51]